MTDRFSYVNGTIKGNKDVENIYGKEWNLNTDEDRIKLCKYLNDREDLIDDLNKEESRLVNVVRDCHDDMAKYHDRLKKQEKIIMYLREICELQQEFVSEIIRNGY